MDVNIRYWDDEKNVTLAAFYDSSKARSSQSYRRNLECNQMFGCEKVPSPWFGWTLQELECTWLGRWPPSCQWISENIRHWFLLVAYSSCHGAFQTTMIKPGWDIDKILKALYKVFHESPAPHEVYLREGTSEEFPMKFRSARWIKDQPVANRTLEVWPTVTSTVQHLVTFSKSSQPKNNKNYNTLVRDHQDL